LPPADRPDLPLCVWSASGAVPGRIAAADLIMPCMAIALDARLPVDPVPLAVEAVPADIFGAINDIAYGEPTGFAAIAPMLADPRLALHGVRAGGDSRPSAGGGGIACVAATLTLADDIAFHYVATRAAQRRQGLAGRLITALLHDARARGLRSATLQASPAGQPVYARLGFRTVATLQGYLRP
jgi:GNAT superfamily N-acetyltransferase